jgi:hypothetical protein
MSSLSDVFSAINRLRGSGVVAEYAVGGATAVLFYAEPARTYDLDEFVIVRPEDERGLAPLAGIYEWARSQGYEAEAEHILIDGVPVQFLPAHNALVEESVREARELVYGTVTVRVVGPEHLVALAVQAGGAKRRERAHQLLEAGGVDIVRLRDILTRHALPRGILDADST